MFRRRIRRLMLRRRGISRRYLRSEGWHGRHTHNRSRRLRRKKSALADKGRRDGVRVRGCYYFDATLSFGAHSQYFLDGGSDVRGGLGFGLEVGGYPVDDFVQWSLRAESGDG